jgi:centractin
VVISVQIGDERFRAPAILFNPILIGQEYDGVHQCLVNSINRSDMDLRRTLYENVLLSGGSTLFDDMKWGGWPNSMAELVSGRF